ncbi:hypothetical protein DID88_004077 [Monilinia fructigena]|uniref:Uncharacterized protein n=1 Tax=Monilinia fructigena TaxID=38457 RepID=A0A395IRQ9_9HELO|nr:hypothetical protein DID88_004077 [Monilinia fructigena]
MGLEAQFGDLSRRHYTLEYNHMVVEENYQIAELNTKIFMDAYEMVKDREIQQASYTPYFISNNYGGLKITTEELATVQIVEDKEEIAEMEDYLNGITKKCDIPVESMEEITEYLRLTDDEIEILMEEYAYELTKERGHSASCQPLGPITHSPFILTWEEI